MLIRKVSVFLHATFHTQNRYGAFDQKIVLNNKVKRTIKRTKLQNGKYRKWN